MLLGPSASTVAACSRLLLPPPRSQGRLFMIAVLLFELQPLVDQIHLRLLFFFFPRSQSRLSAQTHDHSSCSSNCSRWSTLSSRSFSLLFFPPPLSPDVHDLECPPSSSRPSPHVSGISASQGHLRQLSTCSPSFSSSLTQDVWQQRTNGYLGTLPRHVILSPLALTWNRLPESVTLPPIDIAAPKAAAELP
mmetsp:Transcript_23680/g.40751  ORF Transcript_23680/g.40751 Transcript_23680/m.40751 type:complete len:192 (-) Transcript_23680:950-1525(-)